MKGLLIAEKRSAKDAIEAAYKSCGGVPGITLDFACFRGHLLGLKEPEEYNAVWADRQDTSILPMVPHPFQYKPVESQAVMELRNKVQSGGYQFLVNACDAGREGELIFYSFYEYIGCTLPVKRLWSSSVARPALEKALLDMKDASVYAGLRQASKFRAEFDWLVGMNFTRAASASLRSFTPVGRVQSATLKLIVDREKEIAGFQSQNFFELKPTFRIGGQDVEFIHLVAPTRKDTRFSAKAAAEAVDADVKAAGGGVVVGVKNDVRSTKAPTLYSLVELQKDANKYLKFKPDKTLAITQKLYEAGLVTYPRSESRFLPTDMANDLPKHLASLNAVPELAPYAAAVGPAQMGQIGDYINDAGVTDHHAIIPTDQMPVWASLSKEEQAIYTLIGKSFLAIFMPPYKAALSTILVKVGEHIFRAQGRTELDKGYSVLYPTKGKTKDVILPACAQGDAAPFVKSSITKGETKPPQRYTPRTILAAMQNAGQDLPDSAMRSVLKESAGLGTSATRAEILQRMEDRELVEVRSNAYYALDAGIRIIDNVGERTFCSALLTGQWEEKLRGIEEGSFKGDFRQEMETYVRDEVSHLLGLTTPTVGVCPSCGGNLIDVGKAVVCEHRKKEDPSSCPVWFSKSIGGYTFTADEVKALVAGEVVGPREIKAKTGTVYNKSFVLKNTGLEFADNAPVTVGKCPVCGGEIRSFGKAFMCENRKQDDSGTCDFWMPRVVGGYNLVEEDVAALLAGKESPERTITNKSGSPWNVVFFMDERHAFQVKGVDAKVSLGVCPVCKKPVYPGQNSFYCAGRSDQSCEWSFPRVIKGTSLKDEDMAKMLDGGRTRAMTFIWNSGRRGKACLYLDRFNNLAWDFVR